MGNSEEGKASKPEKTSAAATDHNNIHVYPEWAAMQAYYGPRLAVPPYMNSAASPHAPPPYMWAPPQSMMPPYGSPYAAFYTHGGVYAHPGIPVATSTLNMETPVKSSGNADGSFVKKLREFDGLVMSIGNGNGNGNVNSGEHGNDRRLTESGETEDSSDGSNGVTAGAFKNSKKRSRQESPSSADGKAQKKSSLLPPVEVSCGSEKPADVITPSTALALKDPSDLNAKSSPTNASQPSMTGDTWLQNERDLKRERRKQSNRESARRSRIRKQAEAEELATQVKILTAENMTLKSERNKLIESSEKLRRENAKLMEKLGNTRLGKPDVNLHKIDDLRLKPLGTVNLLARVNNSDSTDKSNEDGDSYEEHSPETKLHQLLDASPRTDAVAAG